MLIERVYEESGYDKGILIKLKNYTIDFIQYIYKLVREEIILNGLFSY